MEHLRVEEGDRTTLKVRGELDALSSPLLRPTLDALVAACPQKVTIDLSGLRLIDSLGVGVLVWLYKQVRASGGEVRFVGLSHQPLAVFKLLRLDVLFSIEN
jgi:anti-sigma B factor antagonist